MSIIFISIPRLPRNIAQQCARGRADCGANKGAQYRTNCLTDWLQNIHGLKKLHCPFLGHDYWAIEPIQLPRAYILLTSWETYQRPCFFILKNNCFYNSPLSYIENSSINKPGSFSIWLLNSGLAKYLVFSATIFIITSWATTKFLCLLDLLIIWSMSGASSGACLGQHLEHVWDSIRYPRCYMHLWCRFLWSLLSFTVLARVKFLLLDTPTPKM